VTSEKIGIFACSRCQYIRKVRAKSSTGCTLRNYDYYYYYCGCKLYLVQRKSESLQYAGTMVPFLFVRREFDICYAYGAEPETSARPPGVTIIYIKCRNQRWKRHLPYIGWSIHRFNGVIQSIHSPQKANPTLGEAAEP